MLINHVIASELTADATNFSGTLASVVPLLIFLLVFYFLLLRPQQKKQKQHEADVKALKPNDKVVTAGGIYAVVKQVKEKILVLEISNNVLIEVVPDTVTPVIEKNNK
ncbi:MAG: preprotein translocase subunit YajC [Rickettsiales bacterium]|jgi:preprotein translocase subunit YajC|nr:preprotein translocase subunit YajC [Rickettsiales bacterium]